MKRFLLLTAMTLAFLVGPDPSDASTQECVDTYADPVCVAYDKDGKCTNYERKKTTVCTDEADTPRVELPRKDCYECTKWHADGTCLKTKKVQC
jgi:hypothetical protein